MGKTTLSELQSMNYTSTGPEAQIIYCFRRFALQDGEVRDFGRMNMWNMVRQFASKMEEEPPDCRVDGIMFPQGTDDVIKQFQVFEVREDDVWIVTYPKAGTTWVQEIVSCLMYDGDLEQVNQRHTAFRVPFIELDLPEEMRKTKNLPPVYKIIEEMPSPRVIKTHTQGRLLPPQMTEKKPKIIYVLRNPKDLVVSYFFFTKEVSPTPHMTAMSFDEFFQNILTGEVPFGPWWDHYLYFWNRRNESNILVLRFEDIKKDLRGHIEQIAKFIGKNLPVETMDDITEHCTFQNMKKNPMTNLGYVFYGDESQQNFMRKGKVGDWRTHFTVAQNEAMDDHIREKLAGSGLCFDYN